MVYRKDTKGSTTLAKQNIKTFVANWKDLIKIYEYEESEGIIQKRL